MTRILGVSLLVHVIATSAAAAEWGDLQMRFTYVGEPPEPRVWAADKDVAVCGKTKLLDESLLVDKESRGIANVVVMLVNSVDREVPVHESYEKSAAEPAKIVSKNCRFEPHVPLMRTSQRFRWDNTDPIGHNPNINPRVNQSTSLVVPAIDRIELAFPKEEPDPVRLDCNIHPWMSAWIIVRENPYVSLSDKQGKVTLKSVPAGEWSFRIWHERAGHIRSARQGDKLVEWPRKGLQLTIKPGENDAGEFQLAAKLFERR